MLADTGLRPDECFRLRWESIAWVNGRHGTLLVTHGDRARVEAYVDSTSKPMAIFWDFEQGSTMLCLAKISYTRKMSDLAKS